MGRHEGHGRAEAAELQGGVARSRIPVPNSMPYLCLTLAGGSGSLFATICEASVRTLHPSAVGREPYVCLGFPGLDGEVRVDRGGLRRARGRLFC